MLLRGEHQAPMLVHGTVPFRQRARTASHGQQNKLPRKQRLLPTIPSSPEKSSPQRSMMSLITPQMMVDQLYVDDGSGQRPVLEELIIPEVVPGTTPVHGEHPIPAPVPLGPEFQQNVPGGILKNRPDIKPLHSAEINSRYSDNTSKLTSGSERNRWIDVDTMSTGTESELDFTGTETDDSDCSSYCNCQECIDNFRIAGIPPSREKHEISIKDNDTSSKTFGLLSKLFGFGSKRQSKRSPKRQSKREKNKTDEIEMESSVPKSKAPNSQSKEKVTRIAEPHMEEMSDEDEFKGVAQPKTTSSILLDRLSRRQQQMQGPQKRPVAGVDNLAFQGDDSHLSSSPKAYEPLYLRNCSAIELENFVAMLQPSPKLGDILEQDMPELGEERVSPAVSKIDLNSSSNGERFSNLPSTLPIEETKEKPIRNKSNGDISSVIQGKPNENNNVTHRKLNHTIPQVTVTEHNTQSLSFRPNLHRGSSGDTGSDVSVSPPHTSEGATEDEGYVTVTGVSATNC